MKNIRIAINGFGRIGRTFTRIIQEFPQLELVAINDLADTHTLAHLLKYDSVHRGFKGEIFANEKSIVINDQVVHVYNSKDPSGLPWKELGIDVVIESTGMFKTHEKASAHLRAGARKVILSAPVEGDDVKSVVLGVNDSILDGSEEIISNASCTTNNAAPLAHILHQNWGIDSAYITTVHSFTTDQRLHDAPHKDLRRARAATQSIVPTTTGAAKAITKILPDLEGKVGGAGIRVPVPNGSLTDLSCVLLKKASIGEINEKFREAAQGPMKGILQYIDDPIVSVDILENPHSCIFDSLLTSAIGTMVKVVGWYDNEWGYSSRLADLAVKVGSY